MNCEQIIDAYLRLDKREALPLNVKIHLAHCDRCKQTVKKLQTVLYLPNLHHDTFILCEDAHLLEGTMEKIHDLPPPHSSSVKVRYLVLGLMIISMISLIPCTSMGRWANQALGSIFTISLSLMGGLCISVFLSIGVFISSKHSTLSQRLLKR